MVKWFQTSICHFLWSVRRKMKFIEAIFVSDGTRNSLLDMDKPFCYLGIHCILFHILLILWGNYLVSYFFFLSIAHVINEVMKEHRYYVLPCCSEFCDRCWKNVVLSLLRPFTFCYSFRNGNHVAKLWCAQGQGLLVSDSLWL